MAAETQSASARVRRPLDRQLIVSEAVRFIDQHGRDELTMRRLGAELDVEAMALYRYVPGRDSLLDGVVEMVMDELYELTVTQVRHVDTWQEYLQQIAHGVRTVSIAHPQIFPLVATRPPTAPWLRPPLRSLRWVEAFLQGLVEHGMSRKQTVEVYRTFATFLLGHLLLEAAVLGGSLIPEESDPEPEPVPSAAEQHDQLSHYPLLSELSEQLSENTFDTEFEGALEDLIDRLEIVAG